MIDALSLGGIIMLIKLYDFQDCIDYKKLKQKMGAKDGDKIRFTLEKEYIGTITDEVVLYYDKNNDCRELPLEEFVKIEYELKIPYKDLKCAHIDCDKCPLHEIRCNLNGKYRDQTLEEVLNNSISNPKIKEIYEKLLEKEA